jgi:hypothetical protein
MRPCPWLLAALLVLPAGSSTLEAQGGFVRYGRVWSHESAGEEPLFRPLAIAVAGACDVWVADGGNAKVHRWGCDGRPLPSLGRKGEGPGEFQAPSVVQALPGDSVWVWDRMNARLTAFSGRTGQLLGTRRLSISSATNGFVRAFLPARPEWLVFTENYPGAERRPTESLAFLWTLDAEGRAQRAVHRMPAPETVIDRDAGGSASVDAPFQRRPTVLRMPDGSVLIGNTGSTELVRYRPGPRLVEAGRIRLAVTPIPVTAADRRRWSDSVAARLRADREAGHLDAAARASFAARHDRLMRSVTFPPTYPAYTLAAVDPDGGVWIQLASRGGPSRWQIHDGRTGALRRRVELPTRGRITAVAPIRGAVFVIELDEEDVPHVVRYSAPAAPTSR